MFSYEVHHEASRKRSDGGCRATWFVVFLQLLNSVLDAKAEIHVW